MNRQEIPTGAQQAISAAAMTLLTVMVAFIGFSAYNVVSLRTGWQVIDLAHALLSLGAAIPLALVPWVATRSSETEGHFSNMDKARKLYLLGVITAISSILLFATRDFLARGLV